MSKNGAGVVVRQLDADADHEVELLPAVMVCRAVCDVRLGSRQPAGIFVRGTVHTLPRMELGGTLRQPQDAMLVTHPAEQHIGMDEVLLELTCHRCCVQPLTDADIKPHLYLTLELVGVPPHVVAQAEAVVLPLNEGVERIGVPVLIQRSHGIVPEHVIDKGIVLGIRQAPFRLYPVLHRQLDVTSHLPDECVNLRLDGGEIVKAEDGIIGCGQTRVPCCDLCGCITVYLVYLPLVLADVGQMLPVVLVHRLSHGRLRHIEHLVAANLLQRLGCIA